MSVYKLYFPFTGSGDGSASLDIQFDGVITGIYWNVIADLDAGDELYRVEVSFLSTNTFTSNDSRGSIAMAAEFNALLTSGGSPPGVNQFIGPVAIPVSAGERVYLHAALTGTADVRATCYLYVEDASDPRLRRRR